MDFEQRVVLNTNEMEWVPSPKPGVWRKPLAREDAERRRVRLDVVVAEHPLTDQARLEEVVFEGRAAGDEQNARLVVADLGGRDLDVVLGVVLFLARRSEPDVSSARDHASG